jgi:hypothetical protein
MAKINRFLQNDLERLKESLKRHSNIISNKYYGSSKPNCDLAIDLHNSIVKPKPEGCLYLSGRTINQFMFTFKRQMLLKARTKLRNSITRINKIITSTLNSLNNMSKANSRSVTTNAIKYRSGLVTQNDSDSNSVLTVAFTDDYFNNKEFDRSKLTSEDYNFFYFIITLITESIRNVSKIYARTGEIDLEDLAPNEVCIYYDPTQNFSGFVIFTLTYKKRINFGLNELRFIIAMVLSDYRSKGVKYSETTLIHMVNQAENCMGNVDINTRSGDPLYTINKQEVIDKVECFKNLRKQKTVSAKAESKPLFRKRPSILEALSGYSVEKDTNPDAIDPAKAEDNTGDSTGEKDSNQSHDGDSHLDGETATPKGHKAPPKAPKRGGHE